MKTIILGFLAVTGTLAISACTTVVEREPATRSTTTTTTEQTSLSRPDSGTVETQTTRRY